MTNSERRVSYLKGMAAPPGEAKPDLEIFKLFAASPEDVFKEFKRTTRGKDIYIDGDELRKAAISKCAVALPLA